MTRNTSLAYGFAILLIAAVLVWYSNNRTVDLGNSTPVAETSTETIGANDLMPSRQSVEGNGSPDTMIGIDADSEIALALGQISPLSYDHAANSASTYLELIRGNIGNVSPEQIASGSTDSIKNLLLELSTLTGATPDLQIEVTGIRQKAQEVTAIFRQSINGVPVDLLGKVNYTPNGQVTRLNSMLLDASIVDVKPTILEPEAVVHAKTALANELGYALSDVRVNPPEIVKSNFKPPTLYIGLSESSPMPIAYWLVTMMPKESGITYLAKVDANSGDVIVYSNLLNWITRVCKDSGSAKIIACDDDSSINHDIDEIFDESSSSGDPCTGAPADCVDLTNSNPYEVSENVEDMLESNAPGLCCANLGGPGDRLDILVDEDISAAENPVPPNIEVPNTPVYDVVFDGISIPDPSTIPGEFKDGIDFGTESEVIAHEVGHRVVCNINEDNLCVATNTTSAAVIEGLADVIGSIYSDVFDLPGEDWVAGENIFDDPQNPGIRDLTENQDFSSMNSPSTIPQENGKIFANVFYRLKTLGVSNQDLLKVLLETATNMNKNGGTLPGFWDVSDFIDAVEDAGDAVGPSVRDKIDQVLQDMTDPPGLPDAQVSLTECVGLRANFAITFWPNTDGGGPVSYFDVEKKIGTSWYPEYTGDQTCIPSLVIGTKHFRIRAANPAGESGWRTVTAINDLCLGEPDDPVYPPF
jgi:hypothetical protein